MYVTITHKKNGRRVQNERQKSTFQKMSKIKMPFKKPITFKR